MDDCTNCKSRLEVGAKFCQNCGTKIESVNIDETITSINKNITLENSQNIITKRFLYAACISFVIIFLPFLGIEMFEKAFALTMLGLMGFFSSLLIAWMFHSRSKKLQSLISGKNLLAFWQLDSKQKELYVEYLFESQKAKNKAIFTVMVVMFVLIFGIFIAVIEDDAKMPMFLAMLGFIAFLSLFAFGMPYYYRKSNREGDGKILIGAKYAYINGYFHNWDFLLSGLSKIKIIKEPFYGIYLVYYYTDRTLRHTQEIMIPANEDMELEGIIEKMLEANPKVKKAKKYANH